MSITPTAPTHTRMCSALDLRRARLQCHCTHEAARLPTSHQEDSSGCLPQSRRAQLLSLTALLTLPLAQQRAAWSTPVVKVFVAGASGGSGRQAVEQALNRGLTIRAGVRDVAKAAASGLRSSKNLEVVPADVTQSREDLVMAIGDAQAVICTIGSRGFDARKFEEVDRKGVMKLIDAAKQAGVQQFVLQTSLLTNGAAIGQGLNPVYIFLNLATGALSKKLETELYLKQSGLDYTIVRPGGLKDDAPEKVGNLILLGEDTLTASKKDPATAISRQTVGQVLVEAVLQGPRARNRTVEIVASPEAPTRDPNTWF